MVHQNLPCFLRRIRTLWYHGKSQIITVPTYYS